MDNNNITGIKGYYYLLQQITSLLNLSLPEIRQKYINYPYCLIDYFEKGVEEKSLFILSYRHGLYGFDKLFIYLNNEICIIRT